MKRSILFGALIAGLSCSDSSGPTNMGTLTFTYTGAGGGTYSASGPAPAADGNPPTATSWAVGGVNAANAHATVGGSTPRTAGLIDFAVLTFDRATVGSVEIDPGCNWDDDVCAAMILFLNFQSNGDQADFYCGLTAGTLVITEISGGRIKGTFSGTGECSDGVNAPTAFTVTNGTFDVAVVAGFI
jgi:hypothetical protein